MKKIKIILFCLCACLLLNSVAFTQKRKPIVKPIVKKKTTVTYPKVTVVNDIELKNLLKPNGKPLLVNFWATWCDPCREEFPDFVSIDNDYRGKIDFITVSLDDFEDLKVAVPKFLSKMRAKMPAYLVKSADEEKLIGDISSDWQGGLPFTLLYDSTGKIVYSRQGKIKSDLLRNWIDKILISNRIESQNISPK